jgi:hypothetical protein
LGHDYNAILHEFDDRVYAEQPLGFDRAGAERRFRDIHLELEKALGMPLEAETGVYIQDASFHSQIRLGIFDDEIVVIRFSNFGEMIAISGESSLPETLLKRVTEFLGDRGYIHIPESALGDYTGTNPGVDGISSWWIRYFDWL